MSGVGRRMSWHRDREVNRALIGLMDALASWERNTGRRSKLFFFPEAPDEEIIFLDDGKPVNWSPFLIVNQLEIIQDKLQGEVMKVYILFDNDDYYTSPIIAVVSSEEKAEALKKCLQPRFTQDITVDEWPVDLKVKGCG